ncbi:putative serine/threonine-protein kinase WNK5 [Raphanus sativus]|uniref:non-specific serine/threonine protein kinase n=1 Tax=Raphanus sativus TaxID=3726 RepID=A0A6J0K1A0_RAPSA|nr:probable serine/threonine-protein kinase WNK5 [Raphanus sativus]KAJ4890150.1 putative serine/threonine-protein kinase WNK5 [Raphanus sativus]
MYTTETDDYVETDPSGRYGRFREVLGKGAMKTVYKAFDQVLGMEVAWNQVKLNDIFRSHEALQRLYSEVHLLKNLNHDSIIRYCTSWIDVTRRTFNFITELFTSGTLREYRRKYQKVDIRAVKSWSRQILNGLAYMHGHDPPVIHRDLKCDNIFVNGHLGQVKIGDLGLAAVLRESQQAHSVIGTPEFMAPELYDEEYNQLVDIYSFGMCVLEMLTGEYPYVECDNPAQIYKKVTSGTLPRSFRLIQNTEAQRFVGKCLETVSKRLSATELLEDPFLAMTDEIDLAPLSRLPSQLAIQNLAANGTVVEPLLPSVTDPTRTTDMSITGRMNSEDHTIFLQVQISDGNGYMRNIHFPFSIVSDTPLEVALEMVKELEITDWDPLVIAAMIENEISLLVPNWSAHGDPSLLHHSFGHEDDDDDNGEGGGGRRTTRPFYSAACSLVAVNTAHEEDPSLPHDTFGHEVDDDNGEGRGRTTPTFYSAYCSPDPTVAVEDDDKAHEDPSLQHQSFGHEDDDDDNVQGGVQRTLPFSSASASSSYNSPVAVTDNDNTHEEDPSLPHNSFGLEDDDDNGGRVGERTHPYSTTSSSHGSLVAVKDNNNNNNDGSSNDGAGSGRGSNTLLSTSTYQHSPPVDDDDQSPHQRRRRLRLHKMRSLVDTRTQVLHRSLMELINRHTRRGRGSNTNLNELQHKSVADLLRRS